MRIVPTGNYEIIMSAEEVRDAFLDYYDTIAGGEPLDPSFSDYEAVSFTWDEKMSVWRIIMGRKE